MKNDTMETRMTEVFLAIKPNEKNRSDYSGLGDGTCAVRFICDAGNISCYMNDGWSVYRCNGFQRITEVAVELKTEKKDGFTESNQPTITNN